MNSLKNRLRSLAADGVLIIYFVFVLFPILWMVLTSFKRTDELYTTRFFFHPTLRATRSSRSVNSSSRARAHFGPISRSSS